MIMIKDLSTMGEEKAYYCYSALILYTIVVYIIMSNCAKHMPRSHYLSIMIFLKIFLPFFFSSKIVIVERQH